jgi:hypothetical protein
VYLCSVQNVIKNYIINDIGIGKMIKAMFYYTNKSEGSSELATRLGIPRIKHDGSKFRPTSDKIILNWGATTDRFPDYLLTCQVINRPENVDLAVDKLKTFRKFREREVPSPEFTDNREIAIEWLNNGDMVFARTQLRAHSGRGIVILDPEFPDTWDVLAELYVKYMKKKDEFRIHVLRGEVIDVQRKGLRSDLQDSENVNYKVRNLANGFIYVRNDGRAVPECVRTVGISAVSALGLDFGAADVIYNERQNAAYALEVNTAPGLQGTTVENYARALGGL